MTFAVSFFLVVFCIAFGLGVLACVSLGAISREPNPFSAGSGAPLPQGRSSTHGTEQTGASRLVVERNGDLRYSRP